MFLRGANPYHPPPPPPKKNGPSYGFVPLKTTKYKPHIKNRYIGNFMYQTWAAPFFRPHVVEEINDLKGT